VDLVELEKEHQERKEGMAKDEVLCMLTSKRSEEAFHLVEEDYCDNEWSSKLSRNILVVIQC
jgi:hypothetical protein